MYKMFKKILALSISASIILSCVPENVIKVSANEKNSIMNVNKEGGNFKGIIDGVFSSISVLTDEINNSLQLTAKSLEECISGDWKYCINDNDVACIIGYVGDNTVISIPSILDGHKVSKLNCQFLGNKKVSKVYVPKTIQEATDAFANSNVEKIEFEDGTETIPYCICRYANHIESVQIPESVTKIDNGAFDRTNISELKLPSNLTYLGDQAIGYTHVKSIKIPKTIQEATDAFANSNIEMVEFEDGIETIPYCICRYAYRLGSVRIPESVTKIENGAFDRTNISELKLPSNLTYLGDQAIAYTHVKSIKIPKTIQEATDAFVNSNIETVEFEDGIEIIPSYIFRYADKLKTVVIPKSICKINNGAFSNNLLKDIYYGGSEKNWSRISILDDNESLDNASIYYSSYYDIYVKNGMSDSQKAIFPKQVLFRRINQETVISTTDVLNEVQCVNKSFEKIILECRGEAKEKVEKYELLYLNRVISTSQDGIFNDVNVKDLTMDNNQAFKIRIYGKSGEIVYVNLKLYLRDKAEETPMKISLFGEDGFSMTIRGDVPIIGGDTFKLGMEELPMNVEYEGNKVKIGINISKENLEQDEKIKKQIEKAIENKKNDIKEIKKLKSIMQNDDVVGNIPAIKSDVGYSVCGYIEGDINDKKAIGNLIISVSYKDSVTKEDYIPIGGIVIPVTFMFEFDAKGDLTGKFGYDFQNMKFIETTLDFNAAVSMEPYGGVGYKDILSGGIYGNAEVGTIIGILGNNSGLKEIYLGGELGLKGYFAKMEFKHPLVSMSDLKNTSLREYIDDGKLLVYSNEHNSLFNSSMDNLYNSMYFEGDKTLNAQISEKEISTYNISPSKGKAIVLNAYGAAKPQFVSYNGTKMMIYVDYDNTRAVANQTVVKYMIYDDATGTFSKPQIMLDDRTADCEPYVYSDDTGIYCAFLNSNKEYAEGENPEIEEYLSSFGVTVCKYDGSAFNNVGTFHVNDNYCYKPIIYKNNNDIIVSWVENADNAIFGLSEHNSIFTKNLNNNVEPVQLASDLPCVTGIAGGALNGKNQFVYSVDSDNNLTTTEKQVYYVSNGKSNKWLSGDISGLQFAKLPYKSENVLMYEENGIFKFNDDIGSNEQIIAEDITGAGLYNVEGNVIYYLRTAGKTRNICALVWDGKKWNNTSLTESDDYIDSFGVCDDKAVYLETEAQLYSESATGELETTSSIKMLDTLRICKGSLDYIDFDSDKIESGKELPLIATVTNNGTTDIDSLKFIFSSKKTGEEYAVEKNESIAPGETKDIEIALYMPADMSGANYTVKVYDNGESGTKNMLGNPYELNLGLTDVSVETAYVTSETHHKPTFNTIVTNESNVPSNVKTVVTDSDGNVLMTEEENIDAGETVTYSLNVEDILPTDGSYKVLTATATADVEEFYDSNNTSSQSIFSTEKAEIEAETVTDDGKINGFRGNLRWNITSDGEATLSNADAIPGNLWVDDRAEAITKIVVSKDIDKIGADAFANCSSLKNILIENPQCQIDAGAIPLDAVIIAANDSNAHEYAINNGISFVDIKVTNSLYAMSATLKDDIGLNFFLSFTNDVLADPDSYVLLGDIKYLIKDASVGYENNGIQYYVFTKNIAPAQINENIHIKVYNGRGEEKLDYSTSCKDYFDKLSKKTSDENIKNIITALLDYNYYAQKYFKYNMNNMGNVSDDVANVKTGVFDKYKYSLSGDIKGLKYYGSSLILKNRITMRHYFTLDNVSNIDDYSFSINGVEVKPVMKGTNLYCVDIDNIMPSNLLDMYTVTASKGEEKLSINYGVMSYANTLTNSSSDKADKDLKDLVKAIYLYGQSVKKYCES